MGAAVGFQPIHLTAEETIELAREVEERGFASAWTIEFELDTLPYDHAMAMATRMIVVGSAIARSYARHPLSFAETAAAIDQFVPGRFVIGVGTAAARIVNPETATHRWGVAAGSPARRMEEYIDVMRLALTGEPVNYHGEFYNVDDVTLSPVPPSGAIPIYVAAGGHRLFELCGRKADGMFTYLLGPHLFAEAIETMRSAASAAGRDGDAIPVCPVIPTCVADDAAQARAHMKRHLVWYMGMPYYQALMTTNGFGSVAEQVVPLLERGDLDTAASAMPEALIDELAITGTPADCRRQLADHVARGSDIPIIYVFGAGEAWLSAYQRAIDVFAPK
jgi:alkanesulfonate monooxygenase SsuD/methylene tetrahydromethanopterin reductase-like flavin-dependent oxidoreductase (luciferase family)